MSAWPGWARAELVAVGVFCLVGRLAGGCLAGCLAGWLAGWLLAAVCLAGGWLVAGCRVLAAWLAGWLLLVVGLTGASQPARHQQAASQPASQPASWLVAS